MHWGVRRLKSAKNLRFQTNSGCGSQEETAQIPRRASVFLTKAQTLKVRTSAKDAWLRSRPVARCDAKLKAGLARVSNSLTPIIRHGQRFFLMLTPLFPMLLAFAIFILCCTTLFVMPFRLLLCSGRFSYAEGVSFYAAQFLLLGLEFCVWGLPWAPA